MRKSSHHKFLLHLEVQTETGKHSKIAIPMHAVDIPFNFFTPETRWCVLQFNEERCQWEFHSANCHTQVWGNGSAVLGKKLGE